MLNGIEGEGTHLNRDRHLSEDLSQRMRQRAVPLILGVFSVGLLFVMATSCMAAGLLEPSGQEEFSSRLYLTKNQCVFEGFLLSNNEIFDPALLVPQSGKEGWFYRTKQAVVIVEKVWKDLPSRLATGDTISFLYPVGSYGYNKDFPGHTRWIEDTRNGPLGVTVGTSSLFCLNIGETGTFQKGKFFLLKGTQKTEILEYLKNIESDPFFSALLYGGMER